MAWNIKYSKLKLTLAFSQEIDFLAMLYNHVDVHLDK